jgi:hypothetical protein
MLTVKDGNLIIGWIGNKSFHHGFIMASTYLNYKDNVNM